MKLTIGSDHAGYEHKAYLVKFISSLGHQVSDLGGFEGQKTDYPDIAEKVAMDVARKKADFGIVLCGTGIGACITANKVRKIRAALCYNRETALLTREHNNANVLCLGARFMDMEKCGEIITAFLSEPFSKEERHRRRVDKIMKVEERNCAGDNH